MKKDNAGSHTRESKKRTKLDHINYGENHSPNLPHKRNSKKAKDSQDQTPPTVIVSSIEADEQPLQPLQIEFQSARELFPQQQPQALVIPEIASNHEVVSMEIDQDEGQEASQDQEEVEVQDQEEGVDRVEQDRLAQLARIYAPLDQVQVVPEPAFLSYINKKILDELNKHGTFLYKGPNNRCWANYPSHAEVYLQPVAREDAKLFFKSNNAYPAQGSTWVSAIYKRENGEIIPIHIVSESVLGEIYRLKEYRLKFQHKNIPHLGKACLIVKVKDEAAKNTFIQRYVDYVNTVESNRDHFPIIRICYKENQVYKLTRELDVQSVLDLNRRATLERHFQTLQMFMDVYERANREFARKMQRLSQKAEVVNLSPENLDAERMLSKFALEDIEEYENHLVSLKNELLRIRDSMVKARLAADGVEEFLAHIIADLRKLNDLALGLHEISEEYRDYLYDLDNFLSIGNFRNNPGQPSSQIEDMLMQKIIYWVEKNGVDTDFLHEFGSSRELLACMLRNQILMQELSHGPLPLEEKMSLVEAMVRNLQNMPSPQNANSRQLEGYSPVF